MTSFKIRATSWSVAALVFGLSIFVTPAEAQRLDGTGTVATGLLLRQMDGVKRVLMIAAHPDDEDTSLLTTLARGQGAETAYLALTRGDGGQNLIGPELWEGLGIVRTGELLAARDLDGGRQFFTRAFDYGYSKSAEEALSFWPRDELLADVVWVVRSFRPHVIVSVFSGTPSDGHGQHQAAGIMAREAFAAAGDPSRFPEQLEMGVEAWAPSKLYQSSRRRFFAPQGRVDDGSLDVQTGVHDPLLGRSLLQLSMESRSQHRSQNMGAGQPPGPSLTGVILVESRVGDEADEIFAGIDTTLVGLTAGVRGAAAASARGHLEAYRRSVLAAVEEFGLDPMPIAPHLLEARTHLRMALEAVEDAGDAEFNGAIAARLQITDRAVFAATGVSFDVRSEDDLLVPGQHVTVRAQLWNGGTYTVVNPETSLALPEGWTATLVESDGVAADGALAPGRLAVFTYDLTVPEDAAASRPYFLREARDGARYVWPDDPGLWGLARDPELVHGSASFGFVSDDPAIANTIQSTGRVTVSSDWRYVGVNPALGEFDKPVLVVPAVSVSVAPAGVTWPQSKSSAQDVSVVVRTEAEQGSRGSVTMSAPAGWTVTPASQAFALDEAGAERSMTFQVRPDGTASAGRHTFDVSARTDDGRIYGEGYALIDYEHIERTALYAEAEATVSVVPVAVREGVRVGYIMGSGDDGPEAIRQMGAEVDLLDEARVRDGDFGDFTTIVLGVRAYETRPDLQAASAQLLDFARAGGTVIVQYNRGPLGSLAPWEMTVGRGSPRVSDETAPVRMLEPDAPVFTSPNRIDDADFDGWVQERGLYFASNWDERYTPLLELNDPGEEPRHGSMLATSVGDGVFVYSALSFFRQWAGQVPGAYRLFANLISLDAGAWAAFSAR
jgi:LmbE family N-acetylglucosaminyl deacetylase